MSSAQLEINITSFYPYVLVRPIGKPEETTTKGGVYLPSLNELATEAEVVAVAEDGEVDDLEVGDIIFVKKYASFPIASTDLRFVEEEDILGKRNTK